MHSIRPAEEIDAGALCTLHQAPRHDSSRVAFIERSIASRGCYVATVDEILIGYSVLEYSFYENGFISVLYVHPDYRRQRKGLDLMLYVETVCRTAKLFTSTNESNLAMQSLLSKLNYLPSGIIHNLDECDPELVYFKRLKP